eukprot:206801_1
MNINIPKTMRTMLMKLIVKNKNKIQMIQHGDVFYAITAINHAMINAKCVTKTDQITKENGLRTKSVQLRKHHRFTPALKNALIFGVLQSMMNHQKKKQKRNPHIHNNEQNTNNAVDTTWECALCTFQNSKMALQCQVCEVERNGADEEILKRLKSQHDELKQTNDDLDNCYIDRYVEIIADKQQHNTEKNDKEEMDDEPEIISNCDEEFSDHESDNDVAVDMFKNGLTPEIVKRKTKHNNDTLSDTNHTSNHNKQSDLLFALETPAFLEQSGFTCIEHDAEDRYIADIVAATSLNEEEYWNAHNVANTVPWIDAGDELDRMIDGFDHGTIESKKVFSKKTKTGALAKGIDNGSDGEIDEHSVERVNIQREFQYAMRTGHVVRCRLIRRRQFEDWDEGDTHFRICESQFMRSCTHGGVSSHGMQSTLKEVIYVINPKLIKQFQAKKKAMKRRLGGSGVNTILAW